MTDVAQWDVYENPSERARQEIPYLVDVQSALLAGLRTRFVVPLVDQPASGPALPRRLVPSFEIEGRLLRLVPHEAGVIDARVLRKVVANVRGEQRLIADALDTVIAGV